MPQKQRKNSEGKARRLANLKPPFQKGESGNPAGRPAGARNRSTVLRELLATICEFTNPLTLRKETTDLETQIMVALAAKARRGDIAAIKEIQDTLYGKVADKQEHSGDVNLNMMSPEEFKKRANERRKAIEALDD